MSIDLENIGGDVYILLAKGHHTPAEFMREVRKEYPTWPMGMPKHYYCRTIPCRTGEYVCRYQWQDKPGKGAYPVTVSHEAYGDDKYENIIASISGKEE